MCFWIFHDWAAQIWGDNYPVWGYECRKCNRRQLECANKSGAFTDTWREAISWLKQEVIKNG